MRSTYSSKYRRLLARLREARVGAGLTQTEVATAVSRTQSFVSKCESGERRLDVEQIIDQSGRDQLVFHRPQARRLLGMLGAHVVQQAIVMADERRGHVMDSTLPEVPDGTAQSYNGLPPVSNRCSTSESASAA